MEALPLGPSRFLEEVNYRGQPDLDILLVGRLLALAVWEVLEASRRIDFGRRFKPSTQNPFHMGKCHHLQ